MELGISKEIVSWIYPLFMEFIESLSFPNVPTNPYLEPDDWAWDRREVAYRGMELGQEVKIKEVKNIKERLFLDIYYPLTMKIDMYREIKDEWDIFIIFVESLFLVYLL